MALERGPQRDLHPNFTDANVEDILLEANKTQALLYLACVLLMVICTVAGVIGNFIVCIVYFPKVRKSNTNIFILQLGIFDLFVCLIVLPFMLSVILRFYTFDSPVLCTICFYSVYTSTSASLVILVTIALDRYNKVCRPLKPGISVKVSKALFWAALIAGAVSSCLVPFLYGNTIVIYTDSNGFSHQGTTCALSTASRGSLLHMIHVYMLLSLFIGIYCLITILYILVGAELWKRGKKTVRVEPHTTVKNHRPLTDQCHPDRQPSSSDTAEERKGAVRADLPTGSTTHQEVSTIEQIPERKDKWSAARWRLLKATQEKRGRNKSGKTAIMLFVVSVVFLLTWVPLWTIIVEETFKPPLAKNSTSAGEQPDTPLIRFGRSLFLINHAINPIIYSVVSKSFRTDCSLRFKKIWWKLRHH